MRQLIVKVPTENQITVKDAIDKYEGKNTIFLPLERYAVFITHVGNKKVNNLIESINEIEQAEINLIPRGIINLYPPSSEAPDQVADVQPKSSLEIYLGGIQSVGTMFGLIGYSAAAGLIVWIGLYTTTIYLLVAAMLIAPYAGPAMNAALATASGKAKLLKSSLFRYGIAISTGIVTSFILTLIFPLQALTPLMTEVSHVSKVALLLPLISGFAGAVNICQSERDSLVSGAAVGILVAASLAPPVGLIGAGLYMMEWEIVFSSLFRIILQLLGIHISATLVFYFYGKVSPNGVRFLRGSRKLLYAVSMAVVIGLGAMMFWQFSNPPYLRKASMNTELTELLSQELKKMNNIEVIHQDVSFFNTKINNKSVVKFSVDILPKDTSQSDMRLKQDVIKFLKENIVIPEKNVYKVYEVKIVTD